jgi:hypothetical protein
VSYCSACGSSLRWITCGGPAFSYWDCVNGCDRFKPPGDFETEAAAPLRQKGRHEAWTALVAGRPSAGALAA